MQFSKCPLCTRVNKHVGEEGVVKIRLDGAVRFMCVEHTTPPYAASVPADLTSKEPAV